MAEAGGDRSDQELLRAAAARDHSAFAEFYDRHAPRVLGLLLKWLNHRADAEDILQEIFWQVWCRAGQYDAQRSPPLGWVFLIARSRALDHLRRRGPRLASPDERDSGTFEDPASALERGESAKQVSEALRALPEEQRTAISLAFYGGLTHEEVAQRQAVPLGTAKTRIRLAMKRLRDILAN